MGAKLGRWDSGVLSRCTRRERPMWTGQRAGRVDPGTQGSALALIWSRTPWFQVPASQSGLGLAFSRTFPPTAGTLLFVFSVGRRLASLPIYRFTGRCRSLRNPREGTSVSVPGQGQGRGRAKPSVVRPVVWVQLKETGEPCKILRSGPVSAGLLEVKGWWGGGRWWSPGRDQGSDRGVEGAAGGSV